MFAKVRTVIPKCSSETKHLGRGRPVAIRVDVTSLPSTVFTQSRGANSSFIVPLRDSLHSTLVISQISSFSSLPHRLSSPITPTSLRPIRLIFPPHLLPSHPLSPSSSRSLRLSLRTAAYGASRPVNINRLCYRSLCIYFPSVFLLSSWCAPCVQLPCGYASLNKRGGLGLWISAR